MKMLRLSGSHPAGAQPGNHAVSNRDSNRYIVPFFLGYHSMRKSFTGIIFYKVTHLPAGAAKKGDFFFLQL